MTRTEAQTIRKAIKATKADVQVVTVGTGRQVELLVQGADTDRVVDALARAGVTVENSLGSWVVR